MHRFNIRVYGVLINEQKQVLVADEMIRGNLYTKFPGGGLEFGEGTRDCLAREFLEELDLRVEVGPHIYTTDFYVPSAFHPGQQIISIFYRVFALEAIKARISTTPFDFDTAQLQRYEQQQEIETFRFIDWANFSEDSVHLPVDKVVAKQLVNVTI